MTTADVVIIGLLVILAAVICRKDVKAVFNFLGLGSFSLEATDSRHRRAVRHRRTALRESDRLRRDD